MIKEVFIQLIKEYTVDNDVAHPLWQEIEEAYSGKKRFYHTIAHLEMMLEQLETVKHTIVNWNCVLFSLFYHDFIYSATSHCNEEDSAQVAVDRMIQLNVSKQMQEDCRMMILSTKKHLVSMDLDTNYFIDADLSILGQRPVLYDAYADNVRKEYSVYPDIIYKPGRKKVLKHFIAMERIYKTKEFYSNYEIAAKENLNRELHNL